MNDEKKQFDLGTHFVGIGASAGGLEAIEELFSKMVVDSGLAFIVVQHLSPDYKSLMVELLSKKTKIPVHLSEDGMEVKPNNIYMIPPKKNLTIFHGKLILKEKETTRGVNLPIDMFLRSLAEDKAERAIAIILSGTGSDGTRGVRAVKESGGMVMVQEENSAKFDGMPRAAISTGVADFIVPPDDMADQLMAYIGHPYVAGKKPSDRILEDEHGMTKIFSELRSRTKVDFTYYKPSTITRRIERRMTVNQIEDLNEYVDFLQRYPAEVNTLYRELLIGVTSFFRDPEAMTALEKEALLEIIRKVKNREIRFWISGCSTGEEAYSIAILVKEIMAEQGLNRDVKIFATDLDRDAIIQAGTGVYPESITADLTPELLGKYFYKRDEHYQIARHIRELVVFARHNLIKDPPFTKIDLISCRNLLIYLQPVLQKKALEMFNFSLNPGGFLFLGTSETIGEMSDYFETVHQKYKIYRSKGRHKEKRSTNDQDIQTLPPVKNNYLFTTGEPRRFRTKSDDDRLMERFLSSLQDSYLPISVIVNEDMEVVHIFGDTQEIFKVPSGRAMFDITKMAEKDLAIPLATGIQKAFRTKEELVYTNVKFKYRADRKNTTLRILPLPDKKGFDSLVAVLFEQVETEAPQDKIEVDAYDIEEDVQQRIRDLEQELQFARENLQATIEELETSNEELQATNEELLASNEELQSTNEELQSTNEELFTVNAEYQDKITELTEMNNDVENLLSSSGVGILILDENHEIRKFSPKITTIFHILEKDIRRPVGHISHKLKDFNAEEIAAKVQAGKRQQSLELKDTSDNFYLVRVLPYHIGQDAYAGTIFTFVDVTDIKQMEKDLKFTKKRSRDIIHHMPSGLFIYELTSDNDLILEESNHSALEMTGFDREECLGMKFQDLWPNALGSGIFDNFLSVFDSGKPYIIDNLVYTDANISGNYRVTSFLLPENRLAVLFDDMTHHYEKEKRLNETRLKYNTLFDRMNQGVVYQNYDGQIISANPAAEKILGLSLDQMKGKTSMDPDWRVITKDGKDLPGQDHPSMVALKTGKPVKDFIMGVYHPGEKVHRWICVNAVPDYKDGETVPFQVFTMFDDVTDKVSK